MTEPAGRSSTAARHLGVRHNDGWNRCLVCGGVFRGWTNPLCPGPSADASGPTSRSGDSEASS